MLWSDGMDYIYENLKTKICGEYDVIVAGGGIAGVSAALAAARNGSKTLLIEKTIVLGGLATSGHVVYYLPLCDGCGSKILGGIPEELLYASIKYGYGNLPEAWRSGPWRADAPEQVRTMQNAPDAPERGRSRQIAPSAPERFATVFNAPAFVMALDELVLNAGIGVLFDTVFCDVVMRGKICTAVVVENKSGRQAYACKAVVDATGDADVLYRAGADCAEQLNHLTYWAYRAPFGGGRAPAKDRGSGILDLYTIGNFNGSDLPPGLPEFRGTDAREVTEFIFKSRGMAFDALRRNPELAFASFPSQAQFRTTRRFKGDHTFRTEDAGKYFDDSVGCISVWNVREPVYELPFGTLKTELVDNMFAAGRIISAANGQAWEIIRPIPQCAMTGQAAGVAASLSAAGCGKVRVADLQEILKKDGVMIHMNGGLVKQSEKWLEKWRLGDDPWWKDKEDGPVKRIK